MNRLERRCPLSKLEQDAHELVFKIAGRFPGEMLDVDVLIAIVRGAYWQDADEADCKEVESAIRKAALLYRHVQCQQRVN